MNHPQTIAALALSMSLGPAPWDEEDFERALEELGERLTPAAQRAAVEPLALAEAQLLKRLAEVRAARIALADELDALGAQWGALNVTLGGDPLPEGCTCRGRVLSPDRVVEVLRRFQATASPTTGRLLAELEPTAESYRV